jgi:hypothetical protein
MTRQQTADLRVQRTSATTHPLAVSSLPTPRVISHATFTLRAWSNHSRRLEGTVRQTQPHTHLYHRFLISSHASTKQTCGTTQAGIGSHGAKCKTHGSTLQGWRWWQRQGRWWQQRQRRWRQQRWSAQNPMEREKTLPQLQEGGRPQSHGVFLPQREQKQMPQGMGHQTWGMTGTRVPG